MPEACDSDAREASAFWLGTQTSALSSVILTVQFMGSMQVWERKGVAYTASTFLAAPAIAFNASPSLVSAKAPSFEVRPSARCAAMVLLERVAFAPSSQT